MWKRHQSAATDYFKRERFRLSWAEQDCISILFWPGDLSDSRQQLTPEQLRMLMQKLVLRDRTSENPEGQLKLDELRLAIDQLDVTLLTTLAHRMRISREIGDLKRDNSITVLQTSRWEKVLATAIERGKQLGLGEDFVTDVFNRIHLESIAQQQ